MLYTAGKHAVVGMIKQLAYEWGPHIRVNGIAPGGGILGNKLKGPEALNLQDRYNSTIPLDEMLGKVLSTGRVATAEEYAGGVCVLRDACRHDSTYRQRIELRRWLGGARIDRGQPRSAAR